MSDHSDPALRRCGSCRFHDVDGLYTEHLQWAQDIGQALAGVGDIGFCRRGPPVLVPVLKWDELPEIFDLLLRAGWPLTSENEWCGEWQGR